MKTTVYIVTGSTGEYDSWTSWIVCVYSELDKAERRLKVLLDAVAKLDVGIGSKKRLSGAWYSHREQAEKAIASMDEGDPRCDIDYTGVGYSIEEAGADL